MLMPDPSIKPPVDTGEKTISGRTIWNDPETGKDYSERSTTFEIEGKYYTMPTVSEDGSQYTDDQIRDYVKEHGPVDYLTGEELPEFRYKEDAIQYAISRSSTRKPKDMARGGIMNDQMKMFEEGGIADDGMNRDPVSGNEVPSGSLAKEVRDDIPAQLSEGEYVVPADVVRYFGVRVFEEMRNEAKMGLQSMEQDGRIGGEPIMPEGMPQGTPDGQSNITDEDLAQIEQMMTTGVADGGLIDKIAYVAENDPVINKAFNQGGAVVSFAVGGMAQSPYGDATKVDEVIGKFMQMVQNKPQIMDELAKRGIRVTRTGAEQKPQEMQTANSASKTTEPVMAGKPAPTPTPVQAAVGTLALPGAKSESYITSPTMPLPPGFMEGYSVPGSSYTYKGTGVPKSNAVTPSVPAAVGSFAPAAAPNKSCPPGQEYDEAKGMCVPRQDYDGSQKNKPPEPPNYDNYLKKYGEVDFNDPKQFQKYMDDVSEPSKFESSGFAENLSLIPGGIGAIIGFGVSAGQVNNYAELKVAELHAMASGNEELLAMAQAGQKKFLASAGNFVNSGIGKFFAGSGQGALNARYADELKGSGLDLNNIDDWEEEDKEKYARLTKKKTSTAKETPAITAAGARRLAESGSSIPYSKSSGSNAQDRRDKQAAAKASQASIGTKASKKAAQDKVSSSVSQATKDKLSGSTMKAGSGVGGGSGGKNLSGPMNKGGLMKRNEIK